MELDKKYQDLLQAIHSHTGERFLASEVSGKAFELDTDVPRQLEELIEMDLVEFDQKDNAYYLSYDGYNVVEYLEEQKNKKPPMTEEEFKIYVKNKRIGILKNLAKAILLMVVIYLAYQQLLA